MRESLYRPMYYKPQQKGEGFNFRIYLHGLIFPTGAYYSIYLYQYFFPLYLDVSFLKGKIDHGTQRSYSRLSSMALKNATNGMNL